MAQYRATTYSLNMIFSPSSMMSLPRYSSTESPPHANKRQPSQCATISNCKRSIQPRLSESKLCDHRSSSTTYMSSEPDKSLAILLILSILLALAIFPNFRSLAGCIRGNMPEVTCSRGNDEKKSNRNQDFKYLLPMARQSHTSSRCSFRKVVRKFMRRSERKIQSTIWSTVVMLSMSPKANDKGKLSATYMRSTIMKTSHNIRRCDL
mmetsp:Transcript_89547/g.158440  ORF Transcript_89547/g.158440 Transcript_89547/m.158440 type:complete len:208 (+) Transcript_89547:2-625(+)